MNIKSSKRKSFNFPKKTSHKEMEALDNTYLFLDIYLPKHSLNTSYELWNSHPDQVPRNKKCNGWNIFEGTHRGLGPTMNHISLNKYSISSTGQELTGVDFTESLVSEVIWKIWPHCWDGGRAKSLFNLLENVKKHLLQTSLKRIQICRCS